jgi:SAM-dependent methyltransferase
MRQVVMDVHIAKRPEIGAGGYARDDSTLEFYLRINALIEPSSVVLDLGAGRGALHDLESDRIPQSLYALKGRVARLAGCDVDEVVLTNRSLDDTRVIPPDGILPYDDHTFDLVYSDWVLEHIDDVDGFVSEVSRVLKPGGWFCARTPNKWGYIALGSRLVPDRSEAAVLNKLQPGRYERDVFPKRYRLNTLPALKRAFSNWRNCSYEYNATPGYHGNNPGIFTLIELFQKLAPRMMAGVLMVFVQKDA